MDNNSMAIRKLKFHMAGRNPQIVPCLVGPTGIGKTAIVHQVAKELGAELVYFNMAQQNQGDNALPVPHINAGQTLVQYALHHKFQDPEMQKHVCTLVGKAAKFKGKKKKWWKTQTLY